MRVHLVNPSHVSFGVGVITPRWLYVLAAATPARFGDPVIVDETLERLDPDTVAAGRRRRHRHPHRQRAARLRSRPAGARARRLGRLRRHPRHALSGRSRASSAAPTPSSRATATSSGRSVLDDCVGRHAAAALRRRPRRGRAVHGRALGPAADGRYMWASVQTVRGCPKHCSFCSVWRTDGQKPRQRARRRRRRRDRRAAAPGFRFIALADDNFYPVTLEDLAHGARGAPTRRACTSSRRSAPSASS